MTRARNIAGFSTITTTPSPIHVGPIGVLTATRIDGEFNLVDLDTRDITAQGIGVTNLQVSGITTGLNVSGIITAQNGINFNGTSTGLNLSGVTTVADLSATTVSIGGTLTYEDVTNVDSVGVVTARGLSIFGNTTGLRVTGVGTFANNLKVDGQIGVGVDPDTWSTGNSITLGTAQATLWGVSDQVNLSGNAYFNSGWKAAATKAGASQIQQALGNIDFRVSGSVTADNAITFTDAVRITKTGKIGVNITSPNAEVDIVSSVEDSTGTLSAHGVRLAHVGATDEEVIPITAGFLTQVDRARAGIGFISKISGSSEGYGGAIGFYTRNTADGNGLLRSDERMRVREWGDVNISNKLNVAGIVTTTALTVSGATTPVTITHTGGNAMSLTRSSKTLGFNANYGASNTHAAIDVTSGMDLRFSVGGADKVTVDSTGRLGINETAPTDPLHIQNSTSDKGIMIKTTGNTYHTICGDANRSNASDNLLRVDSKWNGTVVNRIRLLAGPDTTNKDDGIICFDTANGGSMGEHMRIGHNGQVFIGCSDVTDSGSSVYNKFAVSGDGNPTIVRSHSNMIYGSTTNSADIHAMQLVQMRYNRYNFVSVHSNTGITGGHLLFYQGSSAVGSITTNDSATSFNTSSDYRLKENETVITDGITRLKTLIPRRFNWKIDETNTPVDGFFAHEVTAVPEAVTGTKDQVATADDVSLETKEGDPIYQSIDQSKLIPLLTAALQEAVTEIETLKTRVTALEGS